MAEEEIEKPKRGRKKQLSFEEKKDVMLKELSVLRQELDQKQSEYKEFLKERPKVEEKQDLGALVKQSQKVFKNSVNMRKAIQQANQIRQVKKRVENAQTKFSK